MITLIQSMPVRRGRPPAGPPKAADQAERDRRLAICAECEHRAAAFESCDLMEGCVRKYSAALYAIEGLCPEGKWAGAALMKD